MSEELCSPVFSKWLDSYRPPHNCELGEWPGSSEHRGTWPRPHQFCCFTHESGGLVEAGLVETIKDQTHPSLGRIAKSAAVLTDRGFKNQFSICTDKQGSGTVVAITSN